MQELGLNEYSKMLTEDTCERDPKGTISCSNDQCDIKEFSPIPYIKSVSEQIKRILNRTGVRLVYEPVPSLVDIFGKPKDKPKASEVKGLCINLTALIVHSSMWVRVSEFYLIFLEVALSNKRRSKKHGGFGCCWQQIGGGNKWVVVVQTV